MRRRRDWSYVFLFLPVVFAGYDNPLQGYDAKPIRAMMPPDTAPYLPPRSPVARGYQPPPQPALFEPPRSYYTVQHHHGRGHGHMPSIQNPPPRPSTNWASPQPLNWEAERRRLFEAERQHHLMRNQQGRFDEEAFLMKAVGNPPPASGIPQRQPTPPHRLIYTPQLPGPPATAPLAIIPGQRRVESPQSNTRFSRPRQQEVSASSVDLSSSLEENPPDIVNNIIVHIYLNTKGKEPAHAITKIGPIHGVFGIGTAHGGPGTHQNPIVIVKDFDRDNLKFVDEDEANQMMEEGPANIVEVKAMVSTPDKKIENTLNKAVNTELERAIPVVLNRFHGGMEIMDGDLRKELEQALVDEIAKHLGDTIDNMDDELGTELQKELEKELEAGLAGTETTPTPTTRRITVVTMTTVAERTTSTTTARGTTARIATTRPTTAETTIRRITATTGRPTTTERATVRPTTAERTTSRPTTTERATTRRTTAERTTTERLTTTERAPTERTTARTTTTERATTRRTTTETPITVSLGFPTYRVTTSGEPTTSSRPTTATARTTTTERATTPSTSRWTRPPITTREPETTVTARWTKTTTEPRRETVRWTQPTEYWRTEAATTERPTTTETTRRTTTEGETTRPASSSTTGRPTIRPGPTEVPPAKIPNNEFNEDNMVEFRPGQQGTSSRRPPTVPEVTWTHPSSSEATVSPSSGESFSIVTSRPIKVVTLENSEEEEEENVVTVAGGTVTATWAPRPTTTQSTSTATVRPGIIHEIGQESGEEETAPFHGVTKPIPHTFGEQEMMKEGEEMEEMKESQEYEEEEPQPPAAATFAPQETTVGQLSEQPAITVTSRPAEPSSTPERVSTGIQNTVDVATVPSTPTVTPGTSTEAIEITTRPSLPTTEPFLTRGVFEGLGATSTVTSGSTATTGTFGTSSTDSTSSETTKQATVTPETTRAGSTAPSASIPPSEGPTTATVTSGTSSAPLITSTGPTVTPKATVPTQRVEIRPETTVATASTASQEPFLTHGVFEPQPLPFTEHPIPPPWEAIPSETDEMPPSAGVCPTPNEEGSAVTQADVLFLLDSSNKFTEDKFMHAITLILNTVDRLKNIGPDGIQVSLVQFNSEPYLEFSLRKHNCKQWLKDDIADTQYMTGGSMLGKALEKVMKFAFTKKRGDRPEVPNVLIILTDGQSEDRVQLPVQVSKDHNVTVYVIGTLEANPEYLKNLSGKPENVFQLTSSANTPLASQLADRIDRLGVKKAGEDEEDYEDEMNIAPPQRQPVDGNDVSDEAMPPFHPMKTGIVHLECAGGGFKIQFNLPAKFEGYAVVKGYEKDSQCQMPIKKFSEGGNRTLDFFVAADSCGVTVVTSEDPPGRNSSVIIHLVHAPSLRTEIDRAFLLQCHVGSRPHDGEVSTHLDVVKSEVTIAETISLSSLPPTCSYSIRKDRPDGPIISRATVGQAVYHRWDCDGDEKVNNVYGIRIHSCFASDDVEQKYPIVDSQGCSSDLALLTNPAYDEEHLSAYALSHVFGVLEHDSLKFVCKLSLCTRDGDGCEGVTPPRCSDNHTDLLVWKTATSPTDPALTSALSTKVDIGEEPMYTRVVSAIIDSKIFLAISGLMLFAAATLLVVHKLRGQQYAASTPSMSTRSRASSHFEAASSSSDASQASGPLPDPRLADFLRTFDRNRYV